MHSGNLSLAVVIHGQNGAHEAREYVSPSDHGTYIEGREGSNFTLRIRNGSARRVLAVPSVDGLSVLDGKPAGSGSPGFIIEAHSTLDVPGWMVDRETAAKFFFAGSSNGEDESYVSRIGGDAANKGVIGVMVFEERVPHPVLSHHQSRFGMASNTLGGVLRASSATLSTPEPEAESQSLGAGFGEATGFSTRAASFNRGSRIATLLVHYDDARGLKRRGIDVSRPVARPSAFPADLAGCTPPPGWRR